MNTQDIFTLFPAQQKPEEHDDIAWRKSIPAQVFLNYFHALHYYIAHSPDRYRFDKLPAFQKLENKKGADLMRLRQLLINGWSTEYALRSVPRLGDNDYLRYALHWTFPQAFYAVMLVAEAYYYTQGQTSLSHNKLVRLFGRDIVAGKFPRAISFYAGGHFGNFNVERIRTSKFRPSLSLPETEVEAEAQIASFLKTTRKMKAWEVRNYIQSNPATALRSQSNGNILQKFSAKHWKVVTPYLGYTNILDLMGRLRLSSNYHEIERFVKAEVDFRLFHEALTGTVEYLNTVNEAYIAKTIGVEAYEGILATLPPFMRDNFVSTRFRSYVLPAIEGEGDSTTDIRQAA